MIRIMLIPETNLQKATEGLKALGHETRLTIMCHLMDGEMCVGDLEKVTKSSQSNLSQHLCKMKGLGVIVSEKRGQQVYYRIANPAFSELVKALKVIYCPDL